MKVKLKPGHLGRERLLITSSDHQKSWYAKAEMPSFYNYVDYKEREVDTEVYTYLHNGIPAVMVFEGTLILLYSVKEVELLHR